MVGKNAEIDRLMKHVKNVRWYKMVTADCD